MEEAHSYQVTFGCIHENANGDVTVGQAQQDGQKNHVSFRSIFGGEVEGGDKCTPGQSEEDNG